MYTLEVCQFGAGKLTSKLSKSILLMQENEITEIDIQSCDNDIELARPKITGSDGEVRFQTRNAYFPQWSFQ